MNLERNNRAAFAYLTPALLTMAACGVIPMLFIGYYSLHDAFAGNDFIWVGSQWYRMILTNPDFFAALLRSLGFTALVLAVEIPLGIFIALRMPASGKLASALIVLMAIPLLTPAIVVGYLWKVLVLPKAGLVYELFAILGVHFDMNSVFFTWLALALMDAWHWTSLVILLCYAALRTIPEDYFRAARIDSASGWNIFRFIQLPRLKTVLLIAVLLRLIDSFMIYTEAYVVTRGGPGVSTTFLSHELVQTALIQFDLGEGAAMSVIYFLIVLVLSWAFFSRIVPRQHAQ